MSRHRDTLSAAMSLLRFLFGWQGRVGRRAYAVAGFALFGVKYNIDRFVSLAAFDRTWMPWSYLDVLASTRITELSAADAAFCATLVALALPFVWAGTALTVKRLRDAGLPGGLVALFFVPVVNLLFFLSLCTMPTAAEENEVELRGRLERFMPRSRFGAASTGLALSIAITVPLVWLGVQAFADYGWSLFVGIPFVIGLVAAAIYGYPQRRSLKGSVAVACLALTLCAIVILVLAFEGVLCLLMAAPLAYPLAALGGAAGYWLGRGPRDAAPRAACVAVLVMPVLLGAEGAMPEAPQLHAVRTAVIVDAPPEVVWPFVLAFPRLPVPMEAMFVAGIAYPMEARLEGEGVGAIRYCTFTTGDFVEPITVWEPPYVLAFDIASQPPPMVEWSLFAAVRPPHLDGYFVSERGEFRLIPIEGGRTRVVGTSWYRHRIAPSPYWRLWSEVILHRIHARVLRHIKWQAEGSPTLLLPQRS